MACVKNVGKYQLGRTIGEGNFAKVKLAKNVSNGQMVAIKIIDKQMVIKNKLMYQIVREISAMKLLNHPHIVRIHEVIGTKANIYIVMEYVAGGQLSDKLYYQKEISEDEARRYFHQLIDAVDYCHSRGVYHRDLKPENLLLDTKGNLKVSDFGLSTLQKPGSLLLTACGSPSYVAPELLRNKHYDGAAADAWACGVILFELLAGYLPFQDQNLMSLYRKIGRADYKCPNWFTQSQKMLIQRIFNPIPQKIDYEPAVEVNFEGKDWISDNQAAFDSSEERLADNKIVPQNRGFINAFELIAMAHDFGLSSLLKEQDDSKRILLGSRYTINETIEKIEAAAKDASLSVERMNNSVIKMQLALKSKCRSCFNLLAEVIEVAPTDCVVQVSKSAGTLDIYPEFCRGLSTLLTGNSRPSGEAGI